MTDFETHPAGTAARIAELESANGVHILRALSKQEMVEVEKMAADGKFQEAAQKFGGQVTYHQDQCDLPPMADAELVLHLRGGLVPVSVAYRAASRIEQLEAALTRANAATAAAYEAAAKIADDFVQMRERQIETEKAKTSLHVNVSQIMRWQAGKVQSEAISAAILALATPDQTAALDKLIAEAVEPYRLVLKDMVDSADEISSPLIEAQLLLAASKKGGV